MVSFQLMWGSFDDAASKELMEHDDAEDGSDDGMDDDGQGSNGGQGKEYSCFPRCLVSLQWIFGYLDNALVVVRKLGDLMRTGSHMTGFEEGEEEEWMEGEGEEEEDGDWPLLSNNFVVLFVVGDGLR